MELGILVIAAARASVGVKALIAFDLEQALVFIGRNLLYLVHLDVAPPLTLLLLESSSFLGSSPTGVSLLVPLPRFFSSLHQVHRALK